MGARGNTESELRQRLQRQLRVDDDTFEWLWPQLSKDDDKLISRAVDGGAEEKEDLLCAAKRLLDVGRSYLEATSRSRSAGAGILAGGLRRSRTESTELPLVMGALSSYEFRRTVVVSQALAHDARQQERVRRFREEVVGRPLLWDEARAFVASRANAIFTADELRAGGIPIVGHTAVLSSLQR